MFALLLSDLSCIIIRVKKEKLSNASREFAVGRGGCLKKGSTMLRYSYSDAISEAKKAAKAAKAAASDEEMEIEEHD